MGKRIWLVGVGTMASDYVKVLKALGTDVTAVGRGEDRASAFEKETGIPVMRGGIHAFIEMSPPAAEYAIVSVGVEQLKDVTLSLIQYGIRNILVEKPAGANKDEIHTICDYAVNNNIRVYVAYNRRFYSSVLEAKKIIVQDGGVTSFHFEFTEWSHLIERLEKAERVKKYWFLANSTHVVDMAFFLGGKPKEITCYTAGKLDWHPSASVYAGSGISQNGALFSYQANWSAPGRWGVEVLTKKHRLIFRPLEKLKVQKMGSVAIEPVELDDRLDEEFKPGLFLQVQAFLSENVGDLCTIKEQAAIVDVYRKMANYS